LKYDFGVYKFKDVKGIEIKINQFFFNLEILFPIIFSIEKNFDLIVK